MGRSEPARVLRFVAIGGLSTLIYAAGTLALSGRHGFGMPAGIASVIAYGAGAVFSYCGHRFVTFMSDGAVGFEIARFACATAIGFLLSVGLATIFADLAGFPASVPVVLASILVPVLNFIILRRFVFVGAAG
ncbi:MAG: GtrA family protein [Mesorhizobium sp.]|uniref:GtrA family protein n=1 Tax=Mesorhizobium sp. TaxID=1871066 RepID=UPI000FE84CE7|nr:GtrA family protein [Mesorhizobium sp.]RWM10294.1 MAG: GtrA family protein [Mesorhizobium sp.]TIO52308.1 MAG: GtrA family protein [Mesorhizobium sp.]TIO61194.1 MAG: GtrA family protein [Mesorhizobium sp.]TJV66029.1 MAG: GtrA family protein [Mesorhizobium sp.]